MNFHKDAHAPDNIATRRGLAATRKQRSIVTRTARTIILWSIIATITITGLSYFVVAKGSQRRTLENLVAYSDQRGRAASRIFQPAETNLDGFADRFLELYTDPKAFPDPDFDAYFREDAAGAIRLRDEYFEGIRGANGVIRRGDTGFMGVKRPPLTPELERRLVIAYELVSQYGPAWSGQFANLHVSFPENALIMHWPGEPWGLNAAADLDMTAGAVIKSTLQSENPERRPIWSGLYFDSTAQKWAVTHQRPVDHGGRHLINPSHDIFLDGLIRRLSENHPAGGRNLILAANGNLIAQPERMDEILQSRGVLNVDNIDDPRLLAAYRAIRDSGGVSEPRLIESEALDAYLAVAPIEGPDWWYVTIYPRSVITGTARENAGIILVLGLFLSLFITVLVLAVLRSRVARPMRQMKAAAERIAEGDYAGVADGAVPLPDGQQDEIGLLARAFREMAGRVRNANRTLEETVAARTHDLQLSNYRLEELAARQEAIFDGTIDGIITLDPRGYIESLNPAATRMFGYDADDLIGRNVAILFETPPTQQELERFLARLADKRGGRAADIREFAAWRRDETAFTVQASASAVYLDERLRVVAVIRDVTDRKRVEQMKTEFVSTVSHELRTPLTSIAGSLGLLSGGVAGPLPPRAEKLVRIAHSNSERLVRLVNDILDIEKIESGTMGFEIKPVALGPLIEQAIQANRPFAREYGVALKFGRGGRDVAVLADADRLLQVLTNLLSNAAKFSPRGETVMTTISSFNNKHRITVADKGAGIPDEFRSRIFSKFAQADASDKRQKGGTGLGLSIVREIVTRLGGSVSFDSKPGEGTAFHVDLPAAP